MVVPCPATGRRVVTGGRWPALMDWGLAYTLLSAGVFIERCPECGDAHGWDGLDLIGILDLIEVDAATVGDDPIA